MQRKIRRRAMGKRDKPQKPTHTDYLDNRSWYIFYLLSVQNSVTSHHKILSFTKDTSRRVLLFIRINRCDMKGSTISSSRIKKELCGPGSALHIVVT